MRTLGPWKFPCYFRFLVYQGFKKTPKKYEELGPANYLVIGGYCFIWLLYNEVPLYQCFMFDVSIKLSHRQTSNLTSICVCINMFGPLGALKCIWDRRNSSYNFDLWEKHTIENTQSKLGLSKIFEIGDNLTCAKSTRLQKAYAGFLQWGCFKLGCRPLCCPSLEHFFSFLNFFLGSIFHPHFLRSQRGVFEPP